MANTAPKRSSSFLEHDVRLLGDLSFSGEFYLSGHITGNIVADTDSDSTLYLQDSSEVNGEIRAPNIVVSGTVTGDVFASNRLTLKSTANVVGDVHYAQLEMDNGSSINGTLSALGRD